MDRMAILAQPLSKLISSPGLWALLLLAFTGSLLGASGPHGSVALVAERTSVQPGQPLWVGLHFQLEKDWHIYWINPGDSGEPPTVQWNLPAGFQAKPLQWPVPRRIQDHSLIDYGYQDEVLLPAELKTPAHLADGSKVVLSARVNWLICREVCVPAGAALSLILPVGKGAPSSENPLFTKTRGRLPKPAPKAWKPAAKLGGQHFILDVQAGNEREAVFFPLEPSQVENASPQRVNFTSQGFYLELQKSDQLLRPPSYLAGVLVLASGQGYAIKAPVVSVDPKWSH
jgi:DsbC/DsbD-like thiol-disulfide interchange protein